MKNLPLSSIRPSTTNPRKHFDANALKELAESIKKHGVLQPILVRHKVRDLKNDSPYEIVAGERRFRACQAAGLKEIPAIALTLTDIEAVEIQVIENLQRADLHPMEEAEGYEYLMKQHGYAGADAIAAKIGKSRSYVYGRLKLCALTPEIKKAFLEDSVSPSVALLLARIPASLQAKASKTVLEGKYGEGPLPYRQAVEFLKENYTLTLVGAPFDTKSECEKCPKRTGNEPELFSDIKSAAVCTDPDCFKKKKEDSWANETAAFQASGNTILPVSKSKGLFWGSDLNRHDYVRPKDVCDEDKNKRTYLELLKGKVEIPALDILIAQDGRGKAQKIMKRSRAEELVREAGYKFLDRKMEEKYSNREKTPEEKAAEEIKKASQEVAFKDAVAQIVTKIEAGYKSLSILQCAAREVFDASDRQDEIASRRKQKSNAVLVKAIGSMSVEQCLGLILECFMGKICFSWNGMDEAAFKKSIKEFGLDGSLLLKQALNAAEEKAKK